MLLDRYLVREVTIPFLAVSAILVCIFFTYSLTRFLSDAVSGLLLAREVIDLTLLKTLIALEVLLPIGLYFGIIVGLGRLYSDSEMHVLRGCGVSEGRLLRPIIRVSVLLGILVAELSLFARPWAYHAMYTLEAEAEARTELNRLQPGRFHVYDDQDRAVFIERKSGQGQRAGDLFVRTRTDEGLEVISAKSGIMEPLEREGQYLLELDDAHIFKRGSGGLTMYGELGRFTLSIEAEQPEPVSGKAKATSTLELRETTDTVGIAEYQWRWSTPLSTLLLAMLAVPMSRSQPRRGRYAKLLAALLLYAGYYNLIGIARTWVEHGQVPPAPGIWWVPALLGAATVASMLPWPWIRVAVVQRLRHIDMDRGTRGLQR